MRMEVSFLWRVSIIGILLSLFVTNVQAWAVEYEDEAVSATFVGVSQFSAASKKKEAQMTAQQLPKLVQRNANRAWFFSSMGTINLHQAKAMRPSFAYMGQEPRRLFVKYSRAAVEAISVMGDGDGGFFENGVLGRDFCINGDVIDEQPRCENAATVLTMTYSGSVNEPGRMKGCISDPVTNSVWFNTASPGTASLDRAPVCNLRAFDVNVHVGSYQDNVNWGTAYQTYGKHTVRRGAETVVYLPDDETAWLDCPEKVEEGGAEFDVLAGVKDGKVTVKVERTDSLEAWNVNLSIVCKRTVDSSPSAWIDRTLNKYVHAMDGFQECQKGIAKIGAIAGKIGLAGATFDEVRRLVKFILQKMAFLIKTAKKKPVDTAVKAVPVYGKVITMGNNFMSYVIQAVRGVVDTLEAKWKVFKMMLLQFNTAMAGLDFAGSVTAGYVVGSHRALLHAKKCADMQTTAWELGQPGWELEQEARNGFTGVADRMNAIHNVGKVCGDVFSVYEDLLDVVNKIVDPIAKLRQPLTSFIQAVNELMKVIEDAINFVMESDAMQCGTAIFHPIVALGGLATCPMDEAIDIAYKVAQELVVKNLETFLQKAADELITIVVDFLIPDDFAINMPAFDEDGGMMDPRWLDERFGSCSLDTLTNAFFPQFGEMVNNIMRSLPMDMDGKQLEYMILEQLNLNPNGEYEFSIDFGDYDSKCVEAWNDLVDVPDFAGCVRIAEEIGCATAGDAMGAADAVLDATKGTLQVLADLFESKKKALDRIRSTIGNLPGFDWLIDTYANACATISSQMDTAAAQIARQQQEIDDMKAVQEWSCNGQNGPPPDAAFKMFGFMPPSTYEDFLPPADPKPVHFKKIGNGYCADWIYPTTGTQTGAYDDVSDDAQGCMERCSALNPTYTAFYLKGTQCGCSTSTQGACSVKGHSSHTAYVFAPRTFAKIGNGYCADWVYPFTGRQTGGYDDLSYTPQGCMDRCLGLNPNYSAFYLKGTQCGCSTTTNGPCPVTSNALYTAYVINPRLGGTGDDTCGECGEDSHCANGMKCFKRAGWTPVPGCNGLGEKDKSYCYDPSGSIALSGTNPANPTGLRACTEECDYDSDCGFGLKCFQRHSGQTIPGCTGGGEHPNSGSDRDWDYCYDPRWSAGTELAQGKPTAQSTTGWAGYSSRAVDGNTRSSWGHGSCTHTMNGAKEWWRVDLQVIADISAVQIWNRADCCGPRINDATIMVGETDDVDSAFPCANIDSISGNKVFSCVAQGQFVFVRNAPNQYLTLCEVKVFGTVVRAAPAPAPRSSCRMYNGSVWRFCGDEPYTHWGLGSQGQARALGNCNYVHGRRKDCPSPSGAVKEVAVVVGSSSSNSKTVDADVIDCPTVVDRSNWLTSDTYGDKFSVTVSNGKVTATRTDSNTGWGMNLKFTCTKTTALTLTRFPLGNVGRSTGAMTASQAYYAQAAFCESKGGRLPLLNELCPSYSSNAESVPALGCEMGDSWVPYAGSRNNWMNIGCRGSTGHHMCKDHATHHGAPRWSKGDTYGDVIDCMAPPAPASQPGNCDATFEELTGVDVQVTTYTGRTTAEKDASCCNKCSLNAECEFWVRATDNNKCWLKKNVGTASPSDSRRGGFKILSEARQCRKTTTLNLAYSSLAASSVSGNAALGSSSSCAKGRLDSPGAWCALRNEKDQWWHLDVGMIKLISGVTTQGRQDANQWVKSYKVKYSLDGSTWSFVDGGKVFTANSDRNTKVSVSFGAPVEARYVVIMVQTWTSHISMRAAVDVCSDS